MAQIDFLMCQEVETYIKQLINNLNISEYKLTIEAGCPKGDNYLGIIAKVAIRSDNADYYWIVKSAPQNKSFRECAVVDKLYEREIYIYEDVFPIFKQFHVERGITDSFVTHAKLIGIHKEVFQEAIIMEDMKIKGFLLKNRKEPLDFEHVKLLMMTYGRLHAISYAIRDQEPELFATMKDKADENFFLCIPEELFRKQEEMFCAKTFKVFEPIKDDFYKDIFTKYTAKSFDIIKDTFRKSYEDPYSVIGHGDSWVNNMLFKYEDQSKSNIPTDVCLLDFQLARCGSPAFDLSYFIFTSTEKILRDEHYDELINLYYGSLCEHLTALGSSPEKMLPFETLQQQLKRYSIVGYFLAQLVLHVMISDSEETPDFSKETEAENLFARLNYESKNEGCYLRRIKGVVVDFIDKGYFDFVDEEYF